MKRSTLSLLFSFLPLSLLAALPLVATAQTAAAPTLLSFQGRLTNPSGNPVADGNYQITFSLWSALTGGTKRWEQVSSSVAVRSGTFAVLLNVGTGFQNGTTAANLFDPMMWLEIKVGSDAALTPRQQLTSTAYALKANTVPDGSLTAAKFQGGVVQPGGAAGGDLTGTYPNPQIKTDASLLYKVSGTIMNASGSGVSVNVQQTTANNEVNDSAWQSFTPTANGQINGLDIHVGTTTGMNKTIPVVLYAGEGTTGTELLRRTVTFSPTLGFQYVDFTAPVTVTGGQKYTWFIGTSSSLKFGYATADPYAGGRADVGATLDYGFRVYMTTGNSAIINVNGKLVLAGAAGLLESASPSNPLALQSAGGNVGIGLTNPGARLEVRASGAGDTVRVSGTGGDAPGFGLYNGSTQNSSLGLALSNLQWSTSAVVGDTVLRTNTGRLLLQNGAGVAAMTVAGNSVGIFDTKTLEFGVGVTKEVSAGKIGYGAFTTQTLDIVGAGTTFNNRKIKFWNEGGATFTGPLIAGLIGTTNAASFDIVTNNFRAMNFTHRQKGTPGYTSINVLGGSEVNQIGDGVIGATIAGGGRNISTNPNARNEINGDWGTIGGGWNNYVVGNAATVGGGQGNVVTGDYAFIAGGLNSIVEGAYAFAAGLGAQVYGHGATAAGGSFNSAFGINSFAAGANAIALHDGTFVWSDSSGSFFQSSVANQFNVRAAGGVRLFSNAAATTGVLLAAGGGSWSNASDKNLKTNFKDMDTGNVLERLLTLPITTWNYKANGDIRHIGPMAQDFYAAFGGLGLDDKHIDTVDADGVALAAIQGLNRKLETQIVALKKDNERKDARISELESRLVAIEAAIAELKAQHK